MRVRIAIDVSNGAYSDTWSSTREISQLGSKTFVEREEYFEALKAFCEKAFTAARRSSMEQDKAP